MKRKTKRAIERKLKAASKTVSKATGSVLDRKSPVKTAAAAATGIVALSAAGFATARALKQRQDDGSAEDATVFRLQASDDGGWVLTGEGQEESRFENKREALRKARAVASAAQPSRLVVHRTDGRIQRTHSY